jgi:hypothetical protein
LVAIRKLHRTLTIDRALLQSSSYHPYTIHTDGL